MKQTNGSKSCKTPKVTASLLRYLNSNVLKTIFVGPLLGGASARLVGRRLVTDLLSDLNSICDSQMFNSCKDVYAKVCKIYSIRPKAERKTKTKMKRKETKGIALTNVQ